MKRKEKVIYSFLTAVACFLGGIGFAVFGNDSVIASAATETKTLKEVSLTMKKGASVRYASSAENSGIRFSVNLSAEDYLGLEANEGAVYQSVGYGMAIMPYTYLEQYGQLTEENLFGDGAKYDWATYNSTTGKWDYTGDNSTKKRIIMLSYGEMTVDSENTSNYVFSGSMSGILPNHLTRDFVGRGYIKAVKADGSVEYLMADYTEDNVHNNVRSIVEVAEKAVADPELNDQTKIDKLTENYLDATNVRYVKFYDGATLLETHQTKKNYAFADTVKFEGVDAEFDHWVDEDGNTVVPNAAYEIVGTTKLYAVYSDSDEKIAAAQSAIDAFLAMNISQGTLVSAQNQYQTVTAALDALRASDYSVIIAENGASINAKVEEINTVLEDSNDLYLQYEGTLFEGTDLLNGMTVLSTAGDKPNSFNVGGTLTNGVVMDPSGTTATWNVTIPAIDFSSLISVSFAYSVNADNAYIGFTDGQYIYSGYSATLAGTITFTNNGGEVKVVIDDTNKATTLTETITDASVLNGTKGYTFQYKNGTAYRQLSISSVTAKSFYDVWSVDGNATLYTGQNLIDNISVSNASGGVPFSESANSSISGGVNYDCSGTAATDWTVYLPKINYLSYKTVSMSFKAVNAWQTLGFVGGDRLSDGGSDSNPFVGTITFTNNGTAVVCVINATSTGNSISYTITDSDVLSGNKAFTLFWNQGAVYRQMSFGPITAEMNFAGRMETAKQAGKQPKTENVTLYTGTDLVNGVTFLATDGTTPHSVSASGLIDDGVQADPSGNVKVWNITLPQINFSLYKTVSFAYQGNETYMRIGFNGGESIYSTSVKIQGTVVITNNGGSLTVMITDSAVGTSISETVTDADVINGVKGYTFYYENTVAYRQLAIGPITAESAVKASSLEGISLEEKEQVLGTPYFSIAEKVLYSGQSLISNVSITPNTNVTINHYNDFFPNAVQFDPGAGNTADRVISLPLITYGNYETVSMEFKARNAGQTFGFVNGDKLSDGGDDSNPFVGTITFTNNYDGTVTCVINATSTGSSVSYTITDTDIINGVSPMTFFWNNGNSYRQILIGEITGYNGKTSISTVPVEYALTDFDASTYETTVYDTDALDRGALLVRPNGDGTLYMETQNVSGGDATENVYTITLPWVDFTTVNYITTTFTTNNGTGIGFTAENTIAVADSTVLTVEASVDDSGAITLTATLENSSGAVLTATFTDTDVINGYKGLSIYVKGIQYTQYSMSNIKGNGKSSLVVKQEQDLNLDVAGGTSGYSEYRIAWDANDEWTTDYYNYEFAAKELASFLGRWTGETYQLVKMYDGSVIESDSKLIVLGGKLAEDAGLTTDGIEKSNGYKVVQDYTNLYIYSPTSEGVLKGLYGFLEAQADVVFYTDEVFTETVTENSVTVGAGTSMIFNPSFNVAQAGYAEMQYSQEYQRRLGMYVDWDVMTGIALKGAATEWNKDLTTSGHNMLDIFPYDTFGATYSDWYVKDDGGNWQLDFTSNNTHLQEMKDMLVASAKVVIANQAQYEYFEFAQPDSHYGPDTAGYLSFMNDVAATLDAWLAIEAPERTIALVMYAYNNTNTAPSSGSIYNGDNVYVAVYFAPVGARYPYKIDDSGNYDKNTSENTFDTSATVYEKLLSWTKLEGFDKDKNLIYWMYGTDFCHYMMPMDTLTNLQYNYQKLYETGTDMIKYQFQTKNKDNVGSDWQRLKTYLSAELAKNVNADVATLQANFMNAMYGAGATYMQQLLSAQQAYCTYDNFNDKDPTFYPNNTENYFGIINGSEKFMSSTYFTKDTLNTWMGYIDSAKNAVNADTSLTDGEKAAMINRIEVEALSIRYMLVSLYSVTTYDASVSAWKTHAASLGCYTYLEGDDTDGNW